MPRFPMGQHSVHGYVRRQIENAVIAEYASILCRDKWDRHVSHGKDTHSQLAPAKGFSNVEVGRRPSLLLLPTLLCALINILCTKQ